MKLLCLAKVRKLVIHHNRSKVPIAITYSILINFQIFKLEWKLDLINFISWVGLKFKEYHFNDSNLDIKLKLFLKFTTLSSMSQTFSFLKKKLHTLWNVSKVHVVHALIDNIFTKTWMKIMTFQHCRAFFICISTRFRLPPYLRVKR